MNKQLGLLALSLFLTVACSTKSTAPVAVERADQSGTQQDVSDVSSSYQTASTANENLWDTTTANDVAASPTPTPSPTPVASQFPTNWGCLTGSNSAVSDGSQPPWYSSSSSSMSPFCFDSGWGGLFGEDDLFDQGLGSFGAMQSCFDYVMSKAPQYCSSSYGAEQTFQMTQMALVRCYRRILKQQRRAAHWNRPQLESYDDNDQAFYYLLQQFSDEGN